MFLKACILFGALHPFCAPWVGLGNCHLSMESRFRKAHWIVWASLKIKSHGELSCFPWKQRKFHELCLGNDKNLYAPSAITAKSQLFIVLINCKGLGKKWWNRIKGRKVLWHRKWTPAWAHPKPAHPQTWKTPQTNRKAFKTKQHCQVG